jgi:hypothetical protein
MATRRTPNLSAPHLALPVSRSLVHFPVGTPSKSMSWTKPLRGEIDGAERDSECHLAPSSEGLFETNDEVTRRWKRRQKQDSSRATPRI